MKIQMLLVCCAALWMCSCSKSGSSDKPAAGQAAAAPDKGAGDDSSKPGTFWELLDKSDLKVVVAPWPPRPGAATLKAEVDPNDDGQPFTGTLAFRISPTDQESSLPWHELPKGAVGQDKTVHFEAPINLAGGSCYIQFRVKGAGEAAYERNHIDLTDWKLDVK